MPPFIPKENIEVAAYGGVARPFITREYDKSSILMIFFSELVQVFPECIVDLKIIGLMAGHIQKGFVPGKIKYCLDVLRPMVSPL